MIKGLNLKRKEVKKKMKMIKKSILALGVVALAAVNVNAGGLSNGGSALKLDGTAYGASSHSAGGIISLDATKFGTAGYIDADGIVTASVTGQSDFAQYRVKVGGVDYWLTILDTGDVANSGDGTNERVRQEVYVRANSQTGNKGVLFNQQFYAKETGSDCTFAATLGVNAGCLDVTMNFEGFNNGVNSDRDFTIDMTLIESGATKRDYQQRFHYGQEENGTGADAPMSMACQFSTCGGTVTASTGVEKGTGANAGKIVTNPDAANGTKLSQVWFQDSIRVSSNETDNIKFKFETIDKDRSETGAGANDYRFQLF